MIIPASLKNLTNSKTILVFQSVPKTGGRFIHRTLERDENINYICLDHCYAMDAPDWCVYQGFKFFGTVEERLEVVLGDKKPAYKKCLSDTNQELRFSVVRNPFSHLYSIFTYGWSQAHRSINALLCAKLNSRRHGDDLDAGLISLSYGLGYDSFSDFVKAWFSDDSKNLIPYFRNFLYFQLFKSSGECYTPYVLRTEHLVTGLECLYDTIGEKPKNFLYRKVGRAKENGGKMNDSEAYKKAYTDEAIDIVMKNCHRELEVFGYDFDGPTDDRAVIETSNILYYPETNKLDLKSNTIEYEKL